LFTIFAVTKGTLIKRVEGPYYKSELEVELDRNFTSLCVYMFLFCVENQT